MPVNPSMTWDQFLHGPEHGARRNAARPVVLTVAEYNALMAEIERLRAAVAAQPQPDTEQVTAWLTEHRWRGRIMAVGGGYTWGIGDVLAAREASAGSATPTDWEAEGRKAAAEGLTSDQAAERFGKLVAGSATPTGDDDVR